MFPIDFTDSYNPPVVAPPKGPPAAGERSSPHSV